VTSAREENETRANGKEARANEKEMRANECEVRAKESEARSNETKATGRGKAERLSEITCASRTGIVEEKPCQNLLHL